MLFSEDALLSVIWGSYAFRAAISSLISLYISRLSDRNSSLVTDVLFTSRSIPVISSKWLSSSFFDTGSRRISCILDGIIMISLLLSSKII